MAWKQKVYAVSPLLLFVLVCVIAPLCEELVFRYLIFEVFDKKTWTPYLVSFFTFMAAHLIYLRDGLFLKWFFDGAWVTVALIYIYRLADWNLFFPITLHFLNNFFWFLFLQ